MRILSISEMYDILGQFYLIVNSFLGFALWKFPLLYHISGLHIEL